jgi:hypothetical protein
MADLTDEQLEGMEMWDRDVMLAPQHRAVGAFLVRIAIAEIRRHRATMKRLEELASGLESNHAHTSSIAGRIRDVIEGDANG